MKHKARRAWFWEFLWAAIFFQGSHYWKRPPVFFLNVTNSSFAGSPLGCRGREYLLFIKELFISLRFIPWFIDSDFQSPMGWVHGNPVCLSYVPSWRVYNIFDLHLPGVLLENITAFGLHIFTIYLWSSANFHICYRGCAKKGWVFFHFFNLLARYGFFGF